MVEIWFDLINTENGEVILYTDSLSEIISYIQNNYFKSFLIKKEQWEDNSITYKIYVS